MDYNIIKCNQDMFLYNVICFFSPVVTSVPPTIIDMPKSVAVPEGADARLPCVSTGNPTTDFTNWTRQGESVRSNPRFAVLEKGALLIQDVRRTDAGEYSCTPYNKVGYGMSKTTRLVLKGR